ncbi:MAG: DUF4145 domain-containing protein [Planctomycetota bacterium]|jgi:hypothetical protein
MSDADRVIEYLESIHSGASGGGGGGASGGCDDCLARKTGIRSRQRVAQICRELAKAGVLVRKKRKCSLGDHTKTVNVPVVKRGRKGRPGPTGGTRRSPPTTRPPTPSALGIEEVWRYVDRFCRAFWVKHMEGDPPSSLAEIITTLRDEELLPGHEANMMHTIRSLRNMLVHENVAFGNHETTIARAAWQIIAEWAEQREGDLWRLTINVCAGRAA